MSQDPNTFIEAMALHLQSLGLPRSTGRVFGCLLLHSEPISLDDLTEELGISKASASTGARYLERLGLVERVARPGARKDYYQTVGDPARALVLHVDSVREMGRILNDGLKAVPGHRSEVRTRLNRMVQIHKEATSFLEKLLRRRYG
ncbi:MAG: MarR family transcriptional regulator [Gemmatimonadetes bacterium]|nr:MarR family transcriptional regulator [Gemmatimonadota bacterium]MBT8404051.1 MarR family transcriptional regulator [Gemmatimonadota bacterium]NNK63916.1 MarR family transcriptional regulator [Gemmatimonadota bacterium]